MKNSKLIRLLKTFSKKEMKQLTEFALVELGSKPPTTPALL